MKTKNTLPIDEIISRLHYDNSSNLIRKDAFNTASLSFHNKKIAEYLNPHALYLQDEKIFALFFDNTANSLDFQSLSKQIWNSQIPLVFICNEQSIEIYNGTSIDLDAHNIKKIKEYYTDNIEDNVEFSFLNISNPVFWSEYASKFSETKLNDTLLDNISYITGELKDRYEISFATNLILRLIFIRYLIDREVDLSYGEFSGDIEQSRTELIETVKDKEKLYNLFKYLKQKFNGNLFDIDEYEQEKLNKEILGMLANFLSGGLAMRKKQFALFPLYDFAIIPIELISNVYEILLGGKKQKQDNAFYTPSYLADYILTKTTASFCNEHEEFKILDPSCGSGVFLVNSYRRMVESKLGNEQYTTNDKLLKNILSKNIFGIDLNEDAINVAIFSLYITILNYKNPKDLSQFTLPELKNKNLFISDFFDDNKLGLLKKNKFNFIIGNPPWGSDKSKLHIEYCKKNNLKDMQQNFDICRSFIFRAKDFCLENTVCCFVIHSKIFYNQKNPSKKFRRYLLEKTKITSIVEMSSVRKLVFKNANAPAAIITFKYNEKCNLSNKIIYTSLKPNMFFKLFDLIVVEKNDIKHIPQQTLYEHDWAWKTIVFGTVHDFNLIKRLQENYKTISEIIEENNLHHGTGIQINGNDKQDAAYLNGCWLIDAKNGINQFYVNVNIGSVFKNSTVRRNKENDKEIFDPPYILLKKGLDTKNYKLRSAYSEEKFIYTDTITGLSGTVDKKNVLLSLTAILNSSFYSYLNLMLGASCGIEREQAFATTVFKFPAIVHEELSNITTVIQQTIKAEKENILEHAPDNSLALIQKLDDVVLNKFELKGNPFISYVINVQIPQLTNSNDNIYNEVLADDLKLYSNCFFDKFSAIYNKSGKYIKINLYPKVLYNFAVFELEICDTPPNDNIHVFSESADNMKEAISLQIFKYNDTFHHIRDVIHFEESSFFIVKPNQYKNWHPAIAEMDCIEALEQILTASKEEK